MREFSTIVCCFQTQWARGLVRWFLRVLAQGVPTLLVQFVSAREGVYSVTAGAISESPVREVEHAHLARSQILRILLADWDGLKFGDRAGCDGIVCHLHREGVRAKPELREVSV